MENEQPFDSLTEKPAQDIDLRRIQSLLFKGKWIIIFFALVGGLSAFLYLRYTDNIYEATSIISFETPADNPLSSISLGGKLSNAENKAVTNLEVLRSREMAEKIVRKLSLTTTTYGLGTFKNSELSHKHSPIHITCNDNEPPLGIEFIIRFTSEQAYELTTTQTPKIVLHGVLGSQLAYQSCKIFVARNPTSSTPLAGLQLGFRFSSTTSAAQQLMQTLEIKPYRGSSIFQIKYRDIVADRASDIINTLTAEYLKDEIVIRQKSSEQTIQFIDTLLVSVTTQLRAAENDLVKFELNNRVQHTQASDYKPNAELIELEKQIEQNKLHLLAIGKLQEFVIRHYSDLSEPELPFAPTLDQWLGEGTRTAMNAWNQLLTKRMLLLQRNSMSSPPVVEANNELRVALKQITQQVAEASLKLKENQQYLSTKLQQVSNALTFYPSIERGFSSVKRAYEINERIYFLLLDKRTEAAIAKAAIVTSSRVVDAAIAPNHPILPKANMVQYGGIVAGIVLGFLFVVGKEVLRQTIADRNELESRSQVPVISEIVESPAMLDGFMVEVLTEPKSAMTESFRALRANLQFLGGVHHPKVITVTSTVSGEGKSFLAINLSAILSLLKKKVLLIDLDMRKPYLHNIMGIENNRGVANVLIAEAQPADVIKSTGYSHLHLMTTGGMPPNPAELINSETFGQMLTTLRQEYDYIVLDTSPVGLVTDAIPALRQADVQLYVFRANYSKRQFLRQINRMHTTNMFKHMYMVLNCVRLNEHGYGYGYSYGSKDNYYTLPAKEAWYKRLIKFLR